MARRFNPDAVARAVDAGIITKADAANFFREPEPAVVLGPPEIELELCLLKITTEKVRLLLLEQKCKGLLVSLKRSNEVAILEEMLAAPDKSSDSITSLADLDRKLRGER